MSDDLSFISNSVKVSGNGKQNFPLGALCRVVHSVCSSEFNLLSGSDQGLERWQSVI